MPIQAKSDQIGVRSKERWGSTVGSEKVGGGAGVPEIRKCDSPSHLPLRQSSPRSTLGGQHVPLYLVGYREAPRCSLVQGLCSSRSPPPIRPTTLVTRLHSSKLACRPPIQQLTAAHCTSGKETQRGPTPQHGNQIRIHAVPQGDPLPVLPDLGTERSHQVSKPIQAPRGWSIGTSCSRRPRHGQAWLGWSTHG